jgi:3-methyl-2-oxobutanoate hydroxymethyltransferase
MKNGADCVKMEGDLYAAEKAAAVVKAGIPVMGHIGLTPQTAASFGGFKVQGKSIESAKKMIENAIAFEEAGVFAIVLECLPSALGTLIDEKLSIPTIGVGAGSLCVIFADERGRRRRCCCICPKDVVWCCRCA